MQVVESDQHAGLPQKPLTNLNSKVVDKKTWGRVSRNAACPCGSGKKYKYCHGRN